MHIGSRHEGLYVINSEEMNVVVDEDKMEKALGGSVKIDYACVQRARA